MSGKDDSEGQVSELAQDAPEEISSGDSVAASLTRTPARSTRAHRAPTRSRTIPPASTPTSPDQTVELVA